MGPTRAFGIPIATPALAYEALPSRVPSGTPLDVSFLVSPAHPSNQLSVEVQPEGREPIVVRAWPEGTDPVMGSQRFRVRLPALSPDETVAYRPLLTRAGLAVERLPARSTQGLPRPEPAAVQDAASLAAAAVPRYEWSSEFLGALTIKLVDPPERLGPGPDGLRITFHFESGEIRGPRMNGKVRGGDWMVIRRDGVGVAEVRITYETTDGALILGRYYGIADLGPDGYERALRNEFDPTPPLVLAPQFTSSHPKWLWLNRLQCLAVGRASMTDLVVRLDVYAIRAGQPLPTSGLPSVHAVPSDGNVR